MAGRPWQPTPRSPQGALAAVAGEGLDASLNAARLPGCPKSALTSALVRPTAREGLMSWRVLAWHGEAFRRVAL